MSNRQQLEQAIAVQESLRGTIDGAILDATIAALQAQLAGLEPSPAPESRRAQATILFLDLAGHTGLIQGRDPEEIMEIIDRALERLAEPIGRYGGRIVRYQGDGYKAAFGLPTAQENDPDNAVLAALDILALATDIATELEAERGLPGFQVRVGIDTGLVIIGGGTEREDAVTGLPVNLAARLESAAEPGTVLISHHTYQHVRGVFDFQPLEPIQAKGFPEPVAVYRVLRRKARSFRTRRRGVEGVVTRMIGRDAELSILQNVFARVTTNHEHLSAVVVGEAGLGKSRLLYEFENWVDLQPVNVQLYRGRARLETQRLPYGLLRDVFVFRCGIFDDDSASAVRAKIVRGFHAVMGEGPDVEMKAHLVGHLLGYDFSSGPYVGPLLADARQLRSQAQFYLTEYFRAAASRDPILLLLEDLHWADDSSLDTVASLSADLHGYPAMILGAARPTLYERQPHWLANRPSHRRVHLSLLGTNESGQLVVEILKRVESVPPALQALIIERAEGNPFYVEELIKMLIEDGVIVKDEEVWHVEAGKLAGAHVPSTLTGVLQARLESLPAGERAVLQRASVVGRLFWDAAVDYIGEDRPDDTPDSLWPDLQRRELVYSREETAFEGTREYVFKHALLRDVTYESVLIRMRRNYHRRAAEWLIRAGGDRVEEYADQIAAHYAAAGDARAEAQWQGRAGLSAADRYALPEAIAALSRALELLPADERAFRFDLLLAREKAYHVQALRAPQLADLDELERLAAALDDTSKRAVVALERAHYHLRTAGFEQSVANSEQALRFAAQVGDLVLQAEAHSYQGNALMFLGDYDGARANLLRALELANDAGAKRVQMETLRTLGVVAEEQGDFAGQYHFYEEALALARELGDRAGERRALNSLGVALQGQGKYQSAVYCYEESLTIARAIGDRIGEGTVLGNMGIQTNSLGDYSKARLMFEEVLQIARDTQDQTGINITLLNLASTLTYQGEGNDALAYYEEALRGVDETGDKPLLGYILNGMGYGLLWIGRTAEAIPLLQQARDLRLELGQPHLAAESRALLAEALAAEGHTRAAVAEASATLDFLVDGQLEDPEDTLRVFLAIYRALAATGDSRAQEVLARAHETLQASAARFDDASRRSYLEKVPWNRAIVALWQERAGA